MYPNVKFLLIDTRETEANYPELVKKFLKDNQYPFYVAFDEKSDDGKEIIRYQLIGYNPNLTADQTAVEIEEIIEKVKAAN